MTSSQALYSRRPRRGQRKSPSHRVGALTFTGGGSNRHPVDALADLRAEIKALQERETALRQVLLVDDADLVGNEWQAEVRPWRQERVNTKTAIEHFGRPALAPFLKVIESDAVYLKRRKP